jgi:hypothetical protein
MFIEFSLKVDLVLHRSWLVFCFSRWLRAANFGEGSPFCFNRVETLCEFRIVDGLASAAGVERLSLN